jgi:ferrous iron transport protein B
VDLPGTYSIAARSPEEGVARDFLCFGAPYAAVVVCDATALERSLHLTLQVLEVCPRTLVCVNLLDEAQRRHWEIDLAKLSELLGVPVIGTSSRDATSCDRLLEALDALLEGEVPAPHLPRYSPPLERAAALLAPNLTFERELSFGRWLALRLMAGEESLLTQAQGQFGMTIAQQQALEQARAQAQRWLEAQTLTPQRCSDLLTCALVRRAEEIAHQVVHLPTESPKPTLTRRLDRIFTSRRTGYPVMIALLALVLWITMVGANYPSTWLSELLFWGQDRLLTLFQWLHAPEWLQGVLVLGAYRTLAWVVSVMLPPMAIFFPLFTLLEEVGYLPRVAYNLDRPFQRCHACGKQALTLCMGLGCNAAGVVGCRIIDSPRERLLAILTNSFVPCNGRFPVLLTLITLFFVGGEITTLAGSLLAACVLTLVLLLGVLATFGATALLSATVLRGTPSAFALELPDYRRPQIGKVLLRSLRERTLFVLGRAVAVAAPAGALLWVLANVTVGGESLLSWCAQWLDPLGRAMGLDGAILIAFVLGLPANEIILPIAMMIYLSQGSLTQLVSTPQLGAILTAQGWSLETAVCMILFLLFHWPCSTTLLTIRRETGAWRWAMLAAVLPTALGVSACLLTHAVFQLWA